MDGGKTAGGKAAREPDRLSLSGAVSAGRQAIVRQSYQSPRRERRASASSAAASPRPVVCSSPVARASRIANVASNSVRALVTLRSIVASADRVSSPSQLLDRTSIEPVRVGGPPPRQVEIPLGPQTVLPGARLERGHALLRRRQPRRTLKDCCAGHGLGVGDRGQLGMLAF